MKARNRIFIFVITSGLVFGNFMISCDMSRKYEKEEREAIQKYLTDNPTLDFDRKASGLYYLDHVVGTGIQPVAHDSVFVKYTGKFLNGVVFDTNVGTSAILAFAVKEGDVISGLDEGITYMKEGGKSGLLVPSSLAYGPSGYYIIPGYTPLLFEIELLQVKKNP